MALFIACGVALHGATRQENFAMRPLKTFLADEAGATAIEYALMSSLIAITLILSLSYLGSQLSSEFSEVSSALK
jgi:pilus assembly protein Flp/PilA